MEILPVDLKLEILSYCNLTDLKNVMNSSVYLHNFMRSSEAYRVWLVQLQVVQQLFEKANPSRKKQYKNTAFLELDNDFEKESLIKTNNGIVNKIENRTIIVMKVIRKQNYFLMMKLVKNTKLRLVETFQENPKYLEIFGEMLRNFVKSYHIEISSFKTLMCIDPFYLFKNYNSEPSVVTSTFLFKVLFASYAERSFNVESPFFKAWGQLTVSQLEPNIKIWKDFYKKNCKTTDFLLIAYFQMPYGLHEDRYMTASALAKIDKKWNTMFIEEFNCKSNAEFIELTDPNCPATVGFQYHYFYKVNKKTGAQIRLDIAY